MNSRPPPQSLAKRSANTCDRSNRPPPRALLETACSAFPDSASLANLHGLCLRAAGEHAAAYAELSRALHLRRIAELHRVEHPREDGTFHYGQFADHIQRFPPGSGLNH